MLPKTDTLKDLSAGFLQVDIQLPRGQNHQKQASWITRLKSELPGIAQKAYFSDGNSYNEEQLPGKDLYIGKKQDLYFVRQGKFGQEVYHPTYDALKEYCASIL